MLELSLRGAAISQAVSVALGHLAVEVRAPTTDWEVAHETRMPTSFRVIHKTACTDRLSPDAFTALKGRR
jgi:hypothetical protein